MGAGDVDEAAIVGRDAARAPGVRQGDLEPAVGRRIVAERRLADEAGEPDAVLVVDGDAIGARAIEGGHLGAYGHQVGVRIHTDDATAGDLGEVDHAGRGHRRAIGLEALEAASEAHRAHDPAVAGAELHRGLGSEEADPDEAVGVDRQAPGDAARRADVHRPEQALVHLAEVFTRAA